MKCKCGNGNFLANQRCVVSVVVRVDNNGNFLENLTKDWSSEVYDANDPEGPFICDLCNAEYDKIK